ncbi:MAG: PD-(D/E)XK nuclease family protein [Clostridia bacterium]|nr:PD-(D/E)XK nuclease family protein [Clostridia bacterium]
MSLHLLVGRSNSKKSKTMYSNILRDEKNSKKAIVFVPDFARIVAEQEYFKFTQKSGMANTKITTIDRFCSQNVNKKELFENKNYLTDMAKKFAIKKCIKDNENVFNIFKKVKDTPGFVDKVCKLIDVFDSEGISEDDLLEITKNQDFFSMKFKELYDVYKLIKQNTQNKFVSSFEQFDYFIQSILDEKIEKINGNTTVYFDFYNNFSKKELEFIKSLLKKEIDVTITLDLDLSLVKENLNDIFDISYDTYNKLKRICFEVGCKYSETILEIEDKNATRLDYLQRNIFTLGTEKYNNNDESISINLLKNPFCEVEFVASSIANMVRKGNIRYKDFKIYHNNEELYELNILRVFSKYNIPVYLNKESNINNDTLVIYLKGLLKLSSSGFGVSTEDILKILKTGLIPFEAYRIDEFENYLLEYGIKAYKLESEFNKNSKEGYEQYDITSINEIREYIVNLINELKNDVSGLKTSKDFTKAIYENLQNRGVLIEYDEQLEKLKKVDQNEYNVKSQIVTSIYEVMDNIALAVEETTFDEYVELLSFGLDNIKLRSIPTYIDQVEVCNIDKARSLPRKYGYILGAFENGLPVLSNSEDIFSNNEIMRLKEMDIEIATTTDVRNNMALFNVYKAINSIEDKLIITVPSSKLTGESLRLSPLIRKIKEIIPVEVLGDLTDKEALLEILPEYEYVTFLEELKKLDEEKSEDKIQELYNTYEFLRQNDVYKSIFDFKRKNETLSSKTLEKLYDKDILSSVSRLEKFKACPLNYYATYVLRLKEKKVYKLSSMDLGSIMHKVLEDYSKFLMENSIKFQDVESDETLIKKSDKQINKSLQEIFDTQYTKYNSNARYIYLKNKLRQGMLNIIINISKSFTQSEFRPLGYEIEFEEGKMFSPIEVNLPNGNKMFLRGKIDRIDTAKINENVYVRVVDYKSSSKDLKLSDVKEGISLQLMTYMAALIENKEKVTNDGDVIPAAVSYFTLNTDTLKFSECILEDNKIVEKIIDSLKMKGIYINDVEVLKKLDNKFADGKMSYIDVTSRKLANKEKSLDESVFVEECKNMKNILSQIGTELISGKVSTCKNNKSCEYCKFSDFCRKAIDN